MTIDNHFVENVSSGEFRWCSSVSIGSLVSGLVSVPSVGLVTRCSGRDLRWARWTSGLSITVSSPCFLNTSVRPSRIRFCLWEARGRPTLQFLVMWQAFSTPSLHFRHVLSFPLDQMHPLSGSRSNLVLWSSLQSLIANSELTDVYLAMSLVTSPRISPAADLP